MEMASDGLAGLSLALNGCFDVLLLDVTLPELDGLEVCRRLREQGDRAPIIMLTAWGGLTDKVAGFDAGADDYVTKPFAVEELVVRINALARRRVGETPGAVLRKADLVLDKFTHEVRRGGDLIALSLTDEEQACDGQTRCGRFWGPRRYSPGRWWLSLQPAGSSERTTATRFSIGMIEHSMPCEANAWEQRARPVSTQWSALRCTTRCTASTVPGTAGA